MLVGCKRAYLVPYYNSSAIYYYHFEHLFLLNQITPNVYILMLCLLVVTFIQMYHIYSLLGQFYSYAGDERVGGGIC